MILYYFYILGLNQFYNTQPRCCLLYSDLLPPQHLPVHRQRLGGLLLEVRALAEMDPGLALAKPHAVHCRKIASMSSQERRSVVAVAPSWDALETPGGVTVVDGGRRAASFVLREGVGAGEAVQPVVLLLGINPAFASYGSEGGFFC